MSESAINETGRLCKVNLQWRRIDMGWDGLLDAVKSKNIVLANIGPYTGSSPDT